MSYPRTVTITTMTDIWDNTATNSTATLHYNNTAMPPNFAPPTAPPTPDATPPDIASASYDTASAYLQLP